MLKRGLEVVVAEDLHVFRSLFVHIAFRRYNAYQIIKYLRTGGGMGGGGGGVLNGSYSVIAGHLNYYQ